MDNPLWRRILAYDLDHPESEYGFSTRLAKENYWTKNFTEKAISEYKKFMYLAATSDQMVSPSEVIDVVWHEHLIFTQSYREFCALLGKQIQHVPSTHNKEDLEKFRSAKVRTRKLYIKAFGEQPKDIWDFAGMYESLRLEKANIKIRTFILLGIFVLAFLAVPAYLLLKPLYVKIENPGFLPYYLILSLIAFMLLLPYNKRRFVKIINSVHPDSFLFDLQPLEIVYLKTQKLHSVINGTLNQLVVDKKVLVSDGSMLELVEKSEPATKEEYQVMEALRGTKKIPYKNLVRILASKPIFSNTQNTLDAVKKYFVKSKKFGWVFYTNFTVLALLLLLGFIRLSTGIMRDKAVTQIAIVLILLTAVSIFFLERLSRQLASLAVINYYRKRFSRLRKTANPWEWDYAFYGPSVLAPVLIPLVGFNSKFTSDDSMGSSSDSSCGSSCSSCGGCGGD
jgi:uncharacterized protein (TIGR04222 family)